MLGDLPNITQLKLGLSDASDATVLCSTLLSYHSQESSLEISMNKSSICPETPGKKLLWLLLKVALGHSKRDTSLP